MHIFATFAVDPSPQRTESRVPLSITALKQLSGKSREHTFIVCHIRVTLSLIAKEEILEQWKHNEFDRVTSAPFFEHQASFNDVLRIIARGEGPSGSWRHNDHASTVWATRSSVAYSRDHRLTSLRGINFGDLSVRMQRWNDLRFREEHVHKTPNVITSSHTDNECIYPTLWTTTPFIAYTSNLTWGNVSWTSNPMGEIFWNEMNLNLPSFLQERIKVFSTKVRAFTEFSTNHV